MRPIALLIATAAWIRALAAAVLVGLAPRAHAEPRHFAVDPTRSTIAIRTGRAGLFKFAGHEHTIHVRGLQGEVTADAATLEASSVALRFGVTALEIDAAREPAGDAPKVRAKMLGPDLLYAERFPEVTVRSTQVSGRAEAAGRFALSVQAEFGLRGATRTLSVPTTVVLEGTTLTATGRLQIRHTDFGMRPTSVAGVVKVKNEIQFEFAIVASETRTP